MVFHCLGYPPCYSRMPLLLTLPKARLGHEIHAKLYLRSSPEPSCGREIQIVNFAEDENSKAKIEQ